MSRRHVLQRIAIGCAAGWLGLVPYDRCAVASASEGGGHGASTEAAGKDEHVESDSAVRGIGLGEFSIRAYYPVETKRSTVTFTLYAIVSSENAAEFERLLENRRHKVRDLVIVATRLVPLADFDDPNLKQFRKRILLLLRRGLPELVLDDIYVSDFQLEVRGL